MIGTTFRVGDRVRLDLFGDGVVLAAKDSANGQFVDVAFDNVGVKKLMTAYTRLEPAAAVVQPASILLWPTKGSWGRVVHRSHLSRYADRADDAKAFYDFYDW